MLKYMPGFGNDFETEALPGSLPQGQNSPQRCAYGLYAEQLSGSPFTAPRGANERSWLYRMRPSVSHVGRFARTDFPLWKTAPHIVDHGLPLGPLRWSPPPFPEGETTFLSGLFTITTAGDVHTQVGMASHLFFVNAPMVDDYVFNADGEMLIAPQAGSLSLFTELGVIEIGPGEIAVIPRGMKFRVEPLGGPSRGYVCENYGAKFTLPERGPIGAELSGQFPRLQDAGRRLRGEGNALPHLRQMVRPVPRRRDRPFPTRRRRLARQLRALQI